LAGITPKLGTNRLFREKTDPAGGIVDRIENEIKSYEAQQNIRPFRNCIEEPLPKLAWTRTVDGYEEALLSAENAIRRIFASLLAARAGFEAGHPEAVLLESFFCKVRLGWLRADDSEILDMLEWAQQIGETQTFLFIERLADELKNARRRIHGLRFNEFRTALVKKWMRYGFWLMSDHLIMRAGDNVEVEA
jgi:hypothetical protein